MLFFSVVIVFDFNLTIVINKSSRSQIKFARRYPTATDFSILVLTVLHFIEDYSSF